MGELTELPIGYFSGTYALQELVQPKPATSLLYRVLDVITGGLGSPTIYRYIPDPVFPLTYISHSGLRITPGEFIFDGATTPRILWIIKGFSPWDWTRAAAIHDWLYEVHDRGKDILGFYESNTLLGEMCRTLGVAEWKISIIVSGADRLGKQMWDDKS